MSRTSNRFGISKELDSLTGMGIIRITGKHAKFKNLSQYDAAYLYRHEAIKATYLLEGCEVVSNVVYMESSVNILVEVIDKDEFNYSYKEFKQQIIDRCQG